MPPHVKLLGRLHPSCRNHHGHLYQTYSCARAISSRPILGCSCVSDSVKVAYLTFSSSNLNIVDEPGQSGRRADVSICSSILGL